MQINRLQKFFINWLTKQKDKANLVNSIELAITVIVNILKTFNLFNNFVGNTVDKKDYIWFCLDRYLIAILVICFEKTNE